MLIGRHGITSCAFPSAAARRWWSFLSPNAGNAIAVDEESIYLAGYNPYVRVFAKNNGTWRYSLTTDGSLDASTNQGIAVDSKYLYAVDTWRGVTMTPKSPGELPQLFRFGNDPGFVATWNYWFVGAEEGKVYWSEQHVDSIRPAPGLDGCYVCVGSASGSPPITDVPAPNGGIAIDQKAIYWSERTAHGVTNTYRLDKACFLPAQPGTGGTPDGGSRLPTVVGPGLFGGSQDRPRGYSPGSAGCTVVAMDASSRSGCLASLFVLAALGMRRRRNRS